jgi:hypothetical protein
VGCLEATPRVDNYGYESARPCSSPGQERLSAATAMRAGHVRVTVARRRAAWVTGELAAGGTSVPVARGCIRCNGSGRLPGQARDVTGKAEAGRGPCSYRDTRRCNDDAATATSSAASSLHQIQAAREVPGHRSRPTPRHAERTAGPHAAAQAARVHRVCRMMHQMQFCLFASHARTYAAAGAGRGDPPQPPV